MNKRLLTVAFGGLLLGGSWACAQVQDRQGSVNLYTGSAQVLASSDGKNGTVVVEIGEGAGEVTGNGVVILAEGEGTAQAAGQDDGKNVGQATAEADVAI